VLEKIGNKYVGYVRNIDDFYIGASDLASAEAILHALQESLRAFELELNDDKTSIKEAHTLIDESLGYSPAGGSIIRHKQLEQKGNDESSR
jgi:hypothetical protein